VDEAGRGPLAGPVVAAAVILSKDLDTSGINDSKKLSPVKREIQRKLIADSGSLCGIGVVDHEVVDRINILNATLLAMKIAVDNLPMIPEMVYIDGRCEIPDLQIRQRAVINGDELEPSIGAASIMAKTHRDRIMSILERKYPGYGFARHKGYATKDHIKNLRRLGPSPVHRKSFHPVTVFFKS
jgi:ribonuclease HII